MIDTTAKLDLRQLKIQAKELLREAQSGNQAALQRVLPYFESSDLLKLANAQLVIARENGFESWTSLRRSIERTVLPSAHALFFAAIRAGDEAAVRRMLGDDRDLAGSSTKGEYGWSTPLHIAADLGHLGIAKALVDAGAEVYAMNQGDYPPVFYAFYGPNKAMVEYLLKASEERDQGIPPTYGCGIDILNAGRLGMLDRVRMHVERDPLAVYRRGCIGDATLHWPSHNNFPEIAELLLDHGAPIEVDEVGLYGGKPLHWASEHAPRSVRILLERGANPNSRNLMKGDFEGFTPLHMAARQPEECIECVELLLAAGADPTLTDAVGRLAVDVARENGRMRMAAFLNS